MKKGPDYILLFFATIYLVVHFIPDLGGADVMGAQWLYTSVVDLTILGYFIWNRKVYSEAIASVISNRFSLLYIFYVLWAFASILYAMNVNETIVCLSRLISTFFVFTNLAILLYKKDIDTYYLPIAFLITFILFYDGLYVMNEFKQVADTEGAIFNPSAVTGNNGNKNVMAASLIIKFPFCLYLILNTKILGKLFGIITLFIGSFAIFILSTRSTFVSLFVILLIFSATTLYFRKKTELKESLVSIAYFLLPVLIAFFFSNMALSSLSDVSSTTGAVTSRIQSIQLNNEASSGRLHLWQGAIDYFLKHPFIGDGYGNWKLASIPYEKEFTNDLFVPYHSHNDFIENAADLGIIGGTAYLGLFILAFIFTIQVWLKEKYKKYRIFTTITFMAFTCYFIDAFLNFPTERTSMQTMLTFSAALLFAPSYLLLNQNKIIPTKFRIIPSIYLIAGIILLGGSIYINQQVYESLKVQKYVMGEIDSDPKMALDEVKSAFPTFPNLSTSTLPIKALVARYYFRDKHYDEAMKLLRESEKVNPALHYNDFIKTAIFAAQQNFDSVSFYAKRAFYNWPRATSYYKNVLFAAAKKRDTLEITKAYNLYKKYRDGGEAVNQYLMAMYEVKGGADKYMYTILDSALVHFPGDSVLLRGTKNLLYQNRSGSNNQVGSAVNAFAASAGALFAKGDYNGAAKLYIKASVVEPFNYTHTENIAICYYTNKNYDKCIAYFDKAIAFPQNNTGKSEFFKAMSLVALGKNTDACGSLQAAKKKNYPDIDKYIALYCK
ncbi:MAG: O-antigen ligase family protein [Bacteroidetes bacterium]|nr:O-antigen ligase family protein [Bacteroidota bacterium]